MEFGAFGACSMNLRGHSHHFRRPGLGAESPRCVRWSQAGSGHPPLTTANLWSMCKHSNFVQEHISCTSVDRERTWALKKERNKKRNGERVYVCVWQCTNSGLAAALARVGFHSSSASRRLWPVLSLEIFKVLSTLHKFVQTTHVATSQFSNLNDLLWLTFSTKKVLSSARSPSHGGGMEYSLANLFCHFLWYAWFLITEYWEMGYFRIRGDRW